MKIHNEYDTPVVYIYNLEQEGVICISDNLEDPSEDPIIGW